MARGFLHIFTPRRLNIFFLALATILPSLFRFRLGPLDDLLRYIHTSPSVAPILFSASTSFLYF